jgi:hypothetical protein
MTEWFKSKRNIRRIGRWCGWAALVLFGFTMLTGYGITQFRIVDTLTLGLLNKPSAQIWHHYTDVPLVILTLTHVVIAVWQRLRGEKRRKVCTD